MCIKILFNLNLFNLLGEGDGFNNLVGCFLPFVRLHQKWKVGCNSVHPILSYVQKKCISVDGSPLSISLIYLSLGQPVHFLVIDSWKVLGVRCISDQPNKNVMAHNCTFNVEYTRNS